MEKEPIKFVVGNNYVTRRNGIVKCVQKIFRDYKEAINLVDNGGYVLTVWSETGKQIDQRASPMNDIISEYIEPKSFDWTKPAQTVSGKKVTNLILLQNSGLSSPLIGVIEGNNFVSAWTQGGINHVAELKLKNLPEPKKMVPLEPGDIKPGQILKYKTWKENLAWVSVIGIHFNQVSFKDRVIDLVDLKKDWLISRDNGLTWQNCEKEG
jgi:hypothetical protein